MPCQIRDLGYGPGFYRPGPKNSLLDIPGLELGQYEIHDEVKGIHVGITVFFPRGVENTRKQPSYAAIHSLNGAGEMTGAHFIKDWGFTNSPIAFTDSMSLGAVYQALVTHGWELSRSLGEDAETGYAHFGFPVVGETWGGGVTDIFDGKSTLKFEEIMMAVNDAKTRSEIGQGSKGGGAGMLCNGHKGGTGTSSRIVPGRDGKEYTVGVLVQTNFGQKMTFQIGGVPVGKLLCREAAKGTSKDTSATGFAERPTPPTDIVTKGSLLVAIVTDAPLLPHQLQRLASRATLGAAATGGHGIAHNTSGDIFIAISTSDECKPKVLFEQPWTRPDLASQGQMGGHVDEGGKESGNGVRRVVETQTVHTVVHSSIDALFMAAAECTEEAILNSMCAAEDLKGFDGTVFKGLDGKKVKDLLEKYRSWA